MAMVLAVVLWKESFNGDIAFTYEVSDGELEFSSMTAIEWP